ncbi:MAG: GNAT family N-acetyltransferase [Bdellovibrionales bacterium]
MHQKAKEFDITSDPRAEDISILDLGLHAAYGDAYQPYQEKQIAIFKRDEKDNVVAGLFGKHYWGWLYVDMLWVARDQRKDGLGSRLVQEAEALARELGLIGIYLWAQEGQAGGFYLKLGFEPFVDIPDFPPGHKRIGFIKRLK